MVFISLWAKVIQEFASNHGHMHTVLDTRMHHAYIVHGCLNMGACVLLYVSAVSRLHQFWANQTIANYEGVFWTVFTFLISAQNKGNTIVQIVQNYSI